MHSGHAPGPPPEQAAFCVEPPSIPQWKKDAEIRLTRRTGDSIMLNLTQRLVIGCAVLAGLTVWLGIAAHKPLAAAGHPALAVVLPVAAVLAAIVTALLILIPVRRLARDTRKIAQGDLDHRSEWSSRDSFGAIAAELNRIAVLFASSASLRPAAARWSSSS